MHSALGPLKIYESTGIQASLQIYRFRPTPGDIVARFRQILGRALIAPQYLELQLASVPVFSDISI